MLDEGILACARNYLRTLRAEEGFEDSFVVVYGSSVTGKTHEWSDIDLMVVSLRFDEPAKRTGIDTLWDVAGRTDVRIEAVPCGLQQWETDDGIPLIEIARQQGVRVDLN